MKSRTGPKHDPTSNHDRLRALCDALEALAEEVSALEHIPLKADDESGCSFRYQSDGGGVVHLQVTDGRVTATTKAHSNAGDSVTRDILGIELEKGFIWDGVEAESAEELAGLLLKHLYRRSDHAAPEP